MHKNRQENGQSMVEFALLITLIVFATVGVLQIVGVDVAGIFCKVISGFGMYPDSCPSPEGYLFFDDFSDDDALDDWDITRGDTWRIEDGELCAGPGGAHDAYATGSEGEDYTISFDATLKSGNGFGTYYRSTDDRVGYTFQFDKGYGRPGAFIYRKWINGREMSPFQPRVSAEAGYEWYGVDRHYDIHVQGNTFTTEIDGVVVATAVDNTTNPIPYYENGRVGLRTWGGTEACFDNFTVSGQ